MKMHVTVVIPTHNRAAYLPCSIESVLSQTHEDWELLVVDDHSTDASPTIAATYTQRDPRVQTMALRRGSGAQAARNLGIKAASDSTDYIAFLDSDDVWMPVFLEKTLRRGRDTQAPIVYTEGKIQYENVGREVSQTGVARLEDKPYPRVLTRPPGPLFSNMIVSRDSLTHIGYLDARIVAFQEWDTCIRLAEKFRFAFVDEPLFIWRRHAQPTISGDPKRNADGYAQVVEKHKIQILHYAGKQALAAHYSKLAQLNHGNRRKTLEFWYWTHTLRMGIEDWTSARRISSHVCMNVLGLSDKPLSAEIQVYG